MSDKLFHQVDDMQVILRRKGGVFSQAKVYTRYVDGKQHLFAGCGGGFVMLLGNGGTSNPNVSWLDIDDPQNRTIKNGHTGRPILV